MRPGAFPPAALRGLLAAIALAGPTLLAGCGSDAPPPGPADPGAAGPGPATSTVPADPRDQLAARAAAAEDLRFTALYTLSEPGRPDRTVAVTTAADRSWRVDIPGGALGGTADVSVSRTAAGIFQCALPSVERPVQPSCVRVADPDGDITADADPRVHHPFTDWIDVLTDPGAPLSVSTSQPLPGTVGSCFAVDSISASLNAPLDAGIYCYSDDGLLTGARLGFGTLVLAGRPAAGPASIALPGPVVAGEPLGMAAPPPAPTPTTAFPE